MTPYGKKLLLAKNAAEFKKLLEISSEGIWDEGQTRWFNTGVVIDNSLYLNSTNLQTASPVEFGGDPFEIKFYAKMTLTETSPIFRVLGTSRSFGYVTRHPNSTTYGVAFYYGTTSASTNYQFPDTGAYYLVFSNNTRYLYQIIYNGSGTVTMKIGGTSKTLSMNIPREPRRLIFGNCTGYIDDFELIDNGVTISKMNFGG